MLKHIVLCAALLSAILALNKGAREDIRSVPTFASLSLCSHPASSSRSSDERERYTQGQQSQIAQRLDGSVKALLPADLLPHRIVVVYCPEDPLVTKFTKRDYHRYRPRDPTKA